MGRQPYIPVYIGDWEQDTNCLSIEAEGAWLKIVFKCWKNKGIFLTDVDSCARLWKVDRQKFASILLELKRNDIGKIEEREDGSILFISRRLVKHFEISAKKADSGSKGGSKKQANRVANNIAKPKQTLEYEYGNEIENEDERKGGAGGKELPVGFDDWWSVIFSEQFIEAYKRDFKSKDVDGQLKKFKLKVENDWQKYRGRDSGGLRTAFQYQLEKSNDVRNELGRSGKTAVNGVKPFAGTGYTKTLGVSGDTTG